MKKLKLAQITGLGVALYASCIGCGKADYSLVQIQVGTYTAFQSLLDMIESPTYATLNNAKLCFKRLRFKAEDSDNSQSSNSQSSDTSLNIDFQPGEVALNSSSVTSLGTVVVPAGNYRRIEFDLQKDGTNCVSGNSVVISNSNGNYNTQDTITIKFAGNFSASSASERVSLGFQAIIDALNIVSSGSQIKTNLENASVKGTF